MRCLVHHGENTVMILSPGLMLGAEPSVSRMDQGKCCLRSAAAAAACGGYMAADDAWQAQASEAPACVRGDLIIW